MAGAREILNYRSRKAIGNMLSGGGNAPAPVVISIQ
jgi:hypothetical protein